MSKPNFFIVGAARTGTTSLWMYLKQHPDIFMPDAMVVKEPSFYCDSYGMRDVEKYQRLFSGVRHEKAIGEASTPYLTSPESAAWIRREIPEAKIIAVLRNPVDRAYSMYRWMVNHGYEWVYPFEKALEIEDSRKQDKDFLAHNPQYFYNYLYFDSGLYSVQLQRYYSVFPASQIKVILLDELKQNTIEAVKEIFSFLGVSTDFSPVIKVHNKAEMRPMHTGIHFSLNELCRKHRHTRISTVARFLFDMNMTLGSFRWPKLAEMTRQKMLSGYRADIKKTESLIHKDLSSWLV